jgi:hypothetical protein
MNKPRSCKLLCWQGPDIEDASPPLNALDLGATKACLAATSVKEKDSKAEWNEEHHTDSQKGRKLTGPVGSCPEA